VSALLKVLSQCPCSGGPGINPLVLLAIVAGIWLLARWIRSVVRKKGVSLMNKIAKILIVAALIAAVAIVIAIKYTKPSADANQPSNQISTPTSPLPKLVDIGAGKCIPCKMMAPILQELKKEYTGRLEVQFIDVWENPAAGDKFGIKLIPTQIFYDASGKELFRHEGFMSKEDILAKWKELGIDLAGTSSKLPTFERLIPAQPDNRPKENICYMCDGDIDTKTLVTVQTEKGPVRLCSPHCYFIMYSCLTEDKAGFEKKVSVTDWATGNQISAASAAYLYGLDETGRPVIKAFADKQTAEGEQKASGGSVIEWAVLQNKELATRCGFCDRAVYPQDGAVVRVGGVNTWGCCSHCALGVAARTGKDIEVHEKDRLTGQEIVVKTLDGNVASLKPPTAVAWFGQRQKPDGTWLSAGCFHQGFFTNADNLKKWVEQNPYETGRLISISQALADKIKLSPEQIQKACKIGECSPK
jgi:thioredoxin 1